MFGVKLIFFNLYGSTFGGVKIDSRSVQLILKGWVPLY